MNVDMASFRNIQRARAFGDRRAYFTSFHTAAAFAKIARAPAVERTCDLKGWVVYFS